MVMSSVNSFILVQRTFSCEAGTGTHRVRVRVAVLETRIDLGTYDDSGVVTDTGPPGVQIGSIQNRHG